MKKVLALVITLVLLLAACTFAIAEDVVAGDYSITVTPDSGDHTYEAYQIFTGDLHEGTLSNIVWGSGVTSAGQTYFGDAATKAAGIKTESDGEAFAAELSGYLNIANVFTSVKNGAEYIINVTEPGYYLVKDKDGSLDGQDEEYTHYILSVLGKVTASPKSSKTPSVEKMVKEYNDSLGTGDYGNAADHDSSDTVSFRIEGTVPSDYDDYTVYEYVFHDVESEGLSFQKDTLKVYVDGNEITSGFEIVHNPDTAKSGGCTFEVKFADLKQISYVVAGSTITLKYDSLISSEYVFEKNNEVYLEYSNDVYHTDSTGKSVISKVTVYTYQLNINKVDGNGVAVSGAEFEISKKDGDAWVDMTSDIVVNAAETVFNLKGIDNGIYRVEETKAPNGYNKIQSFYFRVETETGLVNGVPSIVTFDVYECDADGNRLYGKESNYTINKATGTVDLKVVNQRGSLLPTTGAMGTTLLYTLGGVFVAGALVLLITKRRMAYNN